MTVAVVALALALAGFVGVVAMLVVVGRRDLTELRHVSEDKVAFERYLVGMTDERNEQKAGRVKAEAELAASLVRLRIAQDALNAATAKEATHARETVMADPGALDRLLAAPLPGEAGTGAADHRDPGPDAVRVAGAPESDRSTRAGRR